MLELSTTSKSISTYIFDITSTQFASSGGLNIEVPLGSTVLINVNTPPVPVQGSNTNQTTSEASLTGTVDFNGQNESVNQVSNGVVSEGNNDEGKILFNFANAKQVNIGGEFVNAILAPNAEITGSAQIGGTIMAQSIDYSGEVHNVEFTGSLPAVPEGGSAWSFLLMAGLVSVGALWWRKSSPSGEAA